VKADSVSEAKGKAAAAAARRRIVTGGEKFAKVAAEVSDDPNSARSGGDLGFFTGGTMEPAIEKVAFSLKLNEVSQPVRTPYGWHIVEVLERDTVKTRAGRDSTRNGKPVLEAHARHILIRVPLDDDDIARAKTLADKIHDDLKKGADFVTLVKRYSQYEGPAGPDGDLGMVNVGGLQPAIRAGLENVPVGGISEPLPNSVGFNIFKVMEKKAERPYALDEVREELPKVVAELKFRDRLEEYTKKLRVAASVQIR
jgi:parvulin-like peptidyl-prolyl isomerase